MPSPVVVGGAWLGVRARSEPGMPGRRPWMVGYSDWLSGEQRVSWCCWCISAMWVVRRVVTGGPSEVVSGGGVQALIWIWSLESVRRPPSW